MRGDQFDVVGFDADDTLWRSEETFRTAEAMYEELIAPHAPAGVDVLDALHATELDNITISGYGVKAFALSMVQAAVTSTGGNVPATVIGRLVDHAHEMLMDPVELLPGVPETLAAVSASHRIVLITKGDLVHQTRKIRNSGIEHLFEHVSVVLDKDAQTYRRVLAEWGVAPEHFVFVGNSARSDVLPLIEIGSSAVHVPYHITWEHEIVRERSVNFPVLESISELPGWLTS